MEMVARIQIINNKLSAEPEWPSGIQRCTHRTNGHGFEPWPKPSPVLVDMPASMWIERA